MDFQLRYRPWIHPRGMEDFLSPEDFLAAVKREISTKGHFQARKEIRMDSGPHVSIVEDPDSSGDPPRYRVAADMGDERMTGTFESLEDAIKGANSLASGVTKRFNHRASRRPE